MDPICAALNPLQTFPASQSPQENKKNDQSEYPTVLLLWSLISPVFPTPKSKEEDLVFGHGSEGLRVGSCERQKIAKGRAK